MPLVRISILFILGIVIGRIIDVHPYVLIGSSFCSLFIVALFAWSRWKNRIEWISYLLHFIFLLQGWTGYQIHKIEFDQNHFSYANEGLHLVGAIKSIEPTAKMLKLVISVKEYKNKNDEDYIATGNLLVYADDSLRALKVGDIIRIPFCDSEIEQNLNPNSFDYQQYMYHHKIMHQCFIKNEWEILSNSRSSIQKARTWFSSILDLYIKQPEHNAILRAIAMGDRQGIDDDLSKSFEDTGAIHVLAISGLHIGVLASIFLLLLKLSQRIYYKLSIIILAISFIWSFVLFTGASPSVTRAATMFSLFILTKLSSRNGNIYNIIAASALSILLIDPFVVFHVGFQFSFLAVISIVFFYPVFKRQIPKIFGVSYLVDICLVSLAAQFLIAPLSIYYFHKISLVSAFSSLVAIPAITIILLLVFPLMFFAFVYPVFCPYLAQCISLIIDVLVVSLEWMQSFPFAFIDNIDFAISYVALSYLMISALMLMQVNVKRGALLLLVSILCFQSYHLYKEKEDQNRLDSIVIYDHYKGPVIDFLINGHCINYSNQKMTNTDIDYLTKSNLIANGIKHVINFQDIIPSRAILEFDLNTEKVLVATDVEIIGPTDASIIFLLEESSISKEAIQNDPMIYYEHNKPIEVEAYRISEIGPKIIQ